MNHTNANMPPQVFGAWMAVVAIVNNAINNVAAYDVFWHTVASILTCCAATTSIYFTLKNRK